RRHRSRHRPKRRGQRLMTARSTTGVVFTRELGAHDNAKLVAVTAAATRAQLCGTCPSRNSV
ncbi:MAG: hypothetical protein ACRDRL_16945, partial [Sciscionella sp.]